jgi:Ca-activated chloride channel family protein
MRFDRLLALVSSTFVLAIGLLAGAAPARANGIFVGGETMLPPTPGPRRPGMPRSPVRLVGHRVRAKLNDRLADVTVEQVFHNDAPRQLEGTYLFPLPEGATVSNFAMTMGGRMVEGQIVEAEHARRIYEDIVRSRRDPGLLEYVGRGVFRARVFPIEPHSDLTIRLVYQQVLPEDAGTLELRYPLATDRMNGTPVDDVLVDVQVESPVPIRALYSPSHDVAVAREGDRRARVTYERSRKTTQDRDFLLYVGRSPADVGSSFLSSRAAGEDGTFLAVFAPSTEVPSDRRVPKDVVFVLDVSGSMAGPKMDQARKALVYGIRTLSAGDRFNAIAFSTGLNPFRDALVDATGEVKEAAVRWAEGLQAAGGTNIEGALAQSLPLLGGDRLSMVVFITDGRPSIGERNPDTIVKQVEAAARGRTRVFTFGVGFDLDVGLLDRIAETTHGARDYVTPEEDIEIATGRFFRKVQEPVMTDVRIDFGPGVHDVYPQRLPDLFAGGQVTVFGRYRETGARKVRLTGRVGGREVTQELDVNFRGEEAAPFLPRLWAHRKVAFLIDEIRLHGENKELVDEVIRLATRYAIVTPYTAGLVVEESELERLPAASWRLRLSDGRSRPPGDPAPGSAGGGAGGIAPPATVPPPAPSAEVAKKEAKASTDLAKRKEALGGAGRDDKDDEGLAKAQERVQTVEGKSFVQHADGRWIDTAYDGKAETTKVPAYSEAWFTLSKDAKIAKILALGDRVVFLHDGKVYEVIPDPTPK